MSKEASLIVRKSWMDINNDNITKVDWRGSATSESARKASMAAIYVQLQDDVFAIPTCTMARAMKPKMYPSRFSSTKEFVKVCLEEVLLGPIGKHMDTNDKENCVSRISSHQETIQKCRSMITGSDANRKQTAKATFLRCLGYRKASSSESKNDSEEMKSDRSEEKKRYRDRCFKKNSNGGVNVSFWRTADWDMICNTPVDEQLGCEMNNADNVYDDEGKVDNLFLNEASRRAFLDLRGTSPFTMNREFDTEVTILTIARADACMMNFLQYMDLPGKGGSKNLSFKHSFKILLPLALEQLIAVIWKDISDNASVEISLRIGNSVDVDQDPYSNNLRDWTVVTENPDDKHIYLLVTPKYFNERLCSWMGTVKDAQIGRYRASEDRFTKMSPNMAFDEYEDSDIDDIDE